MVVVTLFEELSHRDGLRVALAGRDDVSLAPILRFLLRHVANPRYSAVLLDVCSLVLGPCPSSGFWVRPTLTRATP